MIHATEKQRGKGTWALRQRSGIGGKGDGRRKGGREMYIMTANHLRSDAVLG